MPCTKPWMLAKLPSTVPTWKIMKQGTLITDYMTSPFYWLELGYVILLTRNHKATLFFCSEPKGPNVVYTGGQEKPTPFFWDCLKDIHSCNTFSIFLVATVSFRKPHKNPNICRSGCLKTRHVSAPNCGASVYQK